MGKFLKWVFWGFVGLVAVGWIIKSSKSPEQLAAEAKARQVEQVKRAEEARERARRELASLPAYTARDLAVAYNANTVAADQVFKGRKYKVSGVVSDINTDIFGNPYVTLRGGVNQFMEPQFSFDDDSASELAKLRKGSKVQIVCVGKGDVAKTPMSGDCVMP